VKKPRGPLPASYLRRQRLKKQGKYSDRPLTLRELAELERVSQRMKVWAAAVKRGKR